MMTWINRKIIIELRNRLITKYLETIKKIKYYE